VKTTYITLLSSHAYKKITPYKSEVSHFDVWFLLPNVKRHHPFFLAYDKVKQSVIKYDMEVTASLTQ